MHLDNLDVIVTFQAIIIGFPQCGDLTQDFSIFRFK